VQQELMRHASITTTMNVYGKAMPSIKRKANSRDGVEETQKEATCGGFLRVFLLLGVFGGLWSS
jgi:hypothetical protein